ncbi:hypothetical protein SAMN05444354_105170 [Stigmatella aurantiaca]|uniref:Lipoprotein n=1 Tax=Stigmatella aurantiaca TaxID=41 RepID=A0A1H7P405_STIAU|nr:hypothetical protein [Stigmatella aurantiaca]SEL30521.1 hypothetical protein SAMN05444354_105170 [Stigmatella aurantiaca]
MSRGRLLALPGALALLVGLPACPDPIGCTTSPALPPSVTELMLVGVPTHLTVHAALPGCIPEAPRPSSLAVELSGPDNLPVPVQKAFEPANPTLGVLHFIPEQAGRYHLFAAFDPVGGIIQADLHAARDRSGETAPVMLPLDCGTLERTQPGAWICDVRVLREGVLVRDFPGSRLAVAGEVVWRMDPRLIERYVDTGTELVLTGTWPHAEGKVEAVLATRETLVALHGQTVQHVAFDGTALTGGAPTRWATGTELPSGLGPKALLMRAGDTLAITAGRPFGSSSPFSNEACPYTVVNGRIERTASACTGFNGSVVGFEPGGLWVEEPGTQTLSYHAWTPGGLMPRAAMSLNGLQTFFTTAEGKNTSVPVLTSSQNFPSSLGRTLRPPHALMPAYDAVQRRLLLEYLDSGMVLPQASSTLMWGRSTVFTSGSPFTALRILSRPPALP